MKTRILFFGQLTDITRCASVELEVPETVFALKEVLFARYPLLKQSKFMIAINNTMALDETQIVENATIALMPPFSGG